MNLRVFYLTRRGLSDGYENCNGSRNLYRSKGENLQFLAYRSSFFLPFPMIEWLLLAAP